MHIIDYEEYRGGVWFPASRYADEIQMTEGEIALRVGGVWTGYGPVRGVIVGNTEPRKGSGHATFQCKP